MPNGDDIDMLLEKLGGDFSMIMKISLGRFSVEEAKQIVELMGKVVINIGDGLTLLHVAAQNDRCDLIEYFCGELHHPLEVFHILYLVNCSKRLPFVDPWL